jgi:hypothetical protein
MAAADKPRGKVDGAISDGLMPTLMLTRGKQILDDPFTSESWKKNWSAYKGRYEIVDNQLRVAEQKDDGHHPEASHRGPFHNVIVQFKFRVDGSPWMGFSFSDKEHVARIMIKPDKVELVKMSGIGPTTKGNTLDRLPMKWEPGRWYTMVIELYGNEIVVHIDSLHVLHGEAEGLDIDKGRIALICGGQYAWYDDMKMWEVELDHKWEKRKPLLLQQKEKRK